VTNSFDAYLVIGIRPQNLRPLSSLGEAFQDRAGRVLTKPTW
jgi:hypothetical protein